MESIHSDFFRSNVTTIILRSLLDEDRYGYDILKEIDRKSQGSYNIKQATLYSCLKRLEKGGFINAFWGEFSSGARRRYYSLTDTGREFLNKNKLEYEYSRTLLDKLLSDESYDLTKAPPFDVNDLRPSPKKEHQSLKNRALTNDIVKETHEENPKYDLTELDKTDFQSSLFDEGDANIDDATILDFTPPFTEPTKNAAPVSSDRATQKDQYSKSQPSHFDFENQLQNARIQDEKYEIAYKNLLYKKESEASKLYDSIYQPYTPVPIHEELPKPVAPPPPPSPTINYNIYNNDALFESYKPTINEYANLSEDEAREYALRKLGIGKYRDIQFNDGFTPYDSNKKEGPLSPPVQAVIGKTPERASEPENSQYTASSENIYLATQDSSFFNKSNTTYNSLTDFNPVENESFDNISVNYKNVFINEILPVYQDYNVGAEQESESVLPEISSNVNIQDVKNSLQDKGYEVKTHNRHNTSDFYAKNYIYINKLTVHSILILYGIWFCEILLSFILLNSFYKLSSVEFICFMFIPAPIPLFFTVLYGINPTKRIKDNFNFKNSLIKYSITAAAIFGLMATISMIFLDAILPQSTAAKTILLPLILFSNIPLYIVIYNQLKKNKKYSLN